MNRQEGSRRRVSPLLRAIGRHFFPNLGTLLLVGLLLWSQQAGAFPFTQNQAQAIVTNALPTWFHYQGYAEDRVGNPINGDVDMDFALYGDLNGGTALWSESHTGGNAVPMQNGEFTVRLGSLIPIPGDVWTHDRLFLGIRVGTDSEMSPREELSTVPRAAQAGLALSVTDGSVGSRQMRPTIMQFQLNNDTVVPPLGPHVIMEFTVDFPVNATYVFFVALKSYHTSAGHRVQVRVQDENGNALNSTIHNSHPIAGNGGTQTGSIIGVYDLSAGPHTLQLLAWNDSTTASGYARAGTEVIAIPFAKVP